MRLVATVWFCFEREYCKEQPTMKVKTLAVICVFFSSLAFGNGFEMTLEAESGHCAFGVPFVLHTRFCNGGEQVAFEGANISYKGGHFAFLLGKDEDTLENMFRLTQNYLAVGPPLRYEGFNDPQFVIHGYLQPGRSAQRTDLLLMREPGMYWIKAVATTANGETFESNTIAATVEPFDADTALARLVGQDREKVLDAGRFVFMAYYAPGVMMDPDTFGMPPKDFVAELRAADPQSPYLEGLDAALASLSLIGESGILMSYGLSSDSYIDLCSDFVKRYPDSPYTQALIPRLYWHEYYNKQDGRPDWALALGKKVLEAPIKHASVASGRIPKK